MLFEGYLTSNAGTAWPFDESDPRLVMDVALLFADGSVTIYPGEDVDDVVIRDVSVSRYGLVDFGVYKMHGNDVVSSETITATVDTSRPYCVVSKLDDGTPGWSSFVLDTFRVVQSEGMRLDGPFSLSPSSFFSRANRVMSFSIVNHDGTVVRGISGNVRMEAGYNMYVGSDASWSSYLASTEVFNESEGVVIAAVPGEGMGRVPCEEEIECSGSGVLVPDAQGDVIISSDDCYQIVPYGDKWVDEDGRTHGTVRITGRCTACCQCDEFVKIGDRLSGQSEVLSRIYSRELSDASTYNSYAKKFNDSLDKVSREEVLVRCVASTQRIDSGDAHPNSMEMGQNDIRGSIDRAQAVVSIKNTSIHDMKVSLTAFMSPQRMASAKVITPNKAGEGWTNVDVEMVDCSSGEFDKSDMDLPSGSGITIWLYGATADTQTPGGECTVNGVATFEWLGGGGGSITKEFSSKEGS